MCALKSVMSQLLSNTSVKVFFWHQNGGGGVLSMENLDLGYVHEARANILDWLKNFQYFCSVYTENF